MRILERLSPLPFSLEHYLEYLEGKNNLNIHLQMDREKCPIHIQWNIIQF